MAHLFKMVVGGYLGNSSDQAAVLSAMELLLSAIGRISVRNGFRLLSERILLQRICLCAIVALSFLRQLQGTTYCYEIRLAGM